MLRYPDSPASNEAADTIFRETNRMVAMINTYLEVLRLDSGARPLRSTPINIHGLVTHVEKGGIASRDFGACCGEDRGLQVTSDEVSGTTFAFVIPRSASAAKPGQPGDADETVGITT